VQVIMPVAGVGSGGAISEWRGEKELNGQKGGKVSAWKRNSKKRDLEEARWKGRKKKSLDAPGRKFVNEGVFPAGTIHRDGYG